MISAVSKTILELKAYRAEFSNDLEDWHALALLQIQSLQFFRNVLLLFPNISLNNNFLELKLQLTNSQLLHLSYDSSNFRHNVAGIAGNPRYLTGVSVFCRTFNNVSRFFSAQRVER